MARYSDIRGVGRSKLIPRKQGETPEVRHERRLKANLSMKATLAAWCCERGVSLNTTNGGHHWQFRGKLLADWWPSSAKLVINTKYDRGLHVHDVTQVMCELEKVLGRNDGSH